MNQYHAMNQLYHLLFVFCSGWYTCMCTHPPPPQGASRPQTSTYIYIYTRTYYILYTIYVHTQYILLQMYIYIYIYTINAACRYRYLYNALTLSFLDDKRLHIYCVAHTDHLSLPPSPGEPGVFPSSREPAVEERGVSCAGTRLPPPAALQRAHHRHGHRTPPRLRGVSSHVTSGRCNMPVV